MIKFYRREILIGIFVLFLGRILFREKVGSGFGHRELDGEFFFQLASSNDFEAGGGNFSGVKL